jgi:putative hydrolase of the HAD superfamily
MHVDTNRISKKVSGNQMRSQLKAILFDMDNTLYNFVDAKIAACNCVVDQIGTGDGMELLRYFLRNLHGFEHHNNIRDFMVDKGVWDHHLFSSACDTYDKVKLHSIVPYPGVYETLSLIKQAGIRMGVVTDAESMHAEKRLKKIGISDYFQCVISPDISGKRKPELDSFLLALNTLQVNPENSWLVGDSLRREVAPGNLLGMTTVYAKYGDWMGIPFPSIKPDYVLDAFGDLPSLLNLQEKRD